MPHRNYDSGINSRRSVSSSLLGSQRLVTSAREPGARAHKGAVGWPRPGAFTLVASVEPASYAGFLACARLLRGDVNDVPSSRASANPIATPSGPRHAHGTGRIRGRAIPNPAGRRRFLTTAPFGRCADRSRGFKPDNVLTWQCRSRDRPKRSNAVVSTTSSCRRSRRALPGVQSVTGIDNLPMEGVSEQPIAVEGRPAEVVALQRNVSVPSNNAEYSARWEFQLLQDAIFRLRIPPAWNTTWSSARRWRSVLARRKRHRKRFLISFTPETVRTVAGVAGDIKARGLDVLEPVRSCICRTARRTWAT